MKLHINRLELEINGDIASATAQEAARLLGPALAEALRGSRPMAAAGSTLNVAAKIDAASLAHQLAGQLAPQLASHLPPRGPTSTRTKPAATTNSPLGVAPGRPADAPSPETKRRN